MKRRRRLLAALAASAFAAPFASVAQQAGKVWRVGVLSLSGRPDSAGYGHYDGFLRRMRELGYIEGKNLVVEWRFADNQNDRLPRMAAELVELKVDVIVTGGEAAIRTAQKSTTTIPIVMGNVADPIRSGFIESLARPGRNITGVSTISADLSAKYLEILLSIVPRLARAAVLFNPESGGNVTALKNIQSAAQRVRVTILPLEMRTPEDIEGAFSRMAREQVQAVIATSNPLFLTHKRRIADLTIKYRLPAITSYGEFVEAGLLLSYGLSLRDSYRHAATYVDKIFKGAKPADLPVEEPTKLEMLINGKTAKALGLTIPQDLLVRADRVIE